MEIRCKLTKKFARFNMNVDFDIIGDQIGIFGESGSGKSTLTALLAGLHTPDSGEIYLNNVCLYDSEKGINLPPEKRRLALVFQQPCLFPHLSVRGNLLYGFKRSARDNRKIDFDAMVNALKLEGILERGVNNLSGGEKQRVALGRAVLANPRLLLMDEPLSALDDSLKFHIIPYLKSVSEQFGIPYLFISHSLMEMRLMVDQLLLVANGRVVEKSTPETLARSRLGHSPIGYINLLKVASPRRMDGLFVYKWGDAELFVSAGNDQPEALFELSSKDIILFKKHPEAISARNLIKCRVESIFPSGNMIGVELACGNNRLVSEVVRQATVELDIVEGCEIYAVMKASAFRRLG